MTEAEHVCVFEIKGGPTFWAECACGAKLAGENGPIVGSHITIIRALKETGKWKKP